MSEVLAFFSAAVIIVRALCQLNHMTGKTRFIIKVPYIFIAVAAFAIFIAPFTANGWRDSAYAFLVFAVALQLCLDTRIRKTRTDLNT